MGKLTSLAVAFNFDKKKPRIVFATEGQCPHFDVFTNAPAKEQPRLRVTKLWGLANALNRQRKHSAFYIPTDDEFVATAVERAQSIEALIWAQNQHCPQTLRATEHFLNAVARHKGKVEAEILDPARSELLMRVNECAVTGDLSKKKRTKGPDWDDPTILYCRPKPYRL